MTGPTGIPYKNYKDMSTVWKFNGNTDGKWVKDTPLGRPMQSHRSYVLNDQIFHLSSNRTKDARYRYSKFHVINRTIFKHNLDINSNKRTNLFNRFFLFIFYKICISPSSEHNSY